MDDRDDFRTTVETRESTRTFEYIDDDDDGIEDVTTTFIPAVAAIEDEADVNYGREDTTYDPKEEKAKERVIIYFIICHGIIILALFILMILPLFSGCRSTTEIVYVNITVAPLPATQPPQQAPQPPKQDAPAPQLGHIYYQQDQKPSEHAPQPPEHAPQPLQQAPQPPQQAPQPPEQAPQHPEQAPQPPEKTQEVPQAPEQGQKSPQQVQNIGK